MRGLALAALVLATAPLYADYTPFYLGLLTEVLVFGLFALAYDVLLGHAGVLSLGHSAFLGVAAYVTGILLARADGQGQSAAVGRQFAGRVGFFLRVDDFAAAYDRMTAAGVEFVSGPRDEPYGRLAVFLDIAGNRWDLLGPRINSR